MAKVILTQPDLFDVGQRLLPEQIASARKKPPLTAAPIGSSPIGETCGSCAHLVHRGKYLKCGLMRAHWTHGAGTDIRARWAACSQWEPEDNAAE